MARETSGYLITELVETDPESRKDLINRIRGRWNNEALKMADGIQKRARDLQIKEDGDALHKKLKDEKQSMEEDEATERENRRNALPWLTRIRAATTAAHWNAPLLHQLVAHSSGIQALLGIDEYEVFTSTVVPQLVKLVAVYTNSRGDGDAYGYIGELRLPSTCETMELPFKPFVLTAFTWWSGKSWSETEIAGLDRFKLPSPEPWLQDPTPELPTLGLSGPFADYLQACHETAQKRSAITDPHEYNALLDKSKSLELGNKSAIQWSVLRSRFIRYCEEKGVNLDTGKDQGLLTHAFLRKFNIMRYVSVADKVERVTGFAELTKRNVPLTVPQTAPINDIRDPNHPTNLARNAAMAEEAAKLADDEAMSVEQREEKLASNAKKPVSTAKSTTPSMPPGLSHSKPSGQRQPASTTKSKAAFWRAMASAKRP